MKVPLLLHPLQGYIISDSHIGVIDSDFDFPPSDAKVVFDNKIYLKKY